MGAGIESQAVNVGAIYVKLKPRNIRQLKQYDMIPMIRSDLKAIPGIKAFPSSFAFASGTRGEAMQFTISGPDLSVLESAVQQFLIKVEESPELGNVDSSLEMNLPQVNLDGQYLYMFLFIQGHSLYRRYCCRFDVYVISDNW